MSWCQCFSSAPKARAEAFILDLPSESDVEKSGSSVEEPLLPTIDETFEGSSASATDGQMGPLRAKPRQHNGWLVQAKQEHETNAAGRERDRKLREQTRNERERDRRRRRRIIEKQTIKQKARHSLDSPEYMADWVSEDVWELARSPEGDIEDW